MPYETREQWLNAAVQALRPTFEQAGKALPSAVRVSLGFALGSRKAIGQCWQPEASAEHIHNVFVSPVLDDLLAPQGVLSTLLHELCHAALPAGTGHKRAFQNLAGRVGLVKPWTTTTASAECITQTLKPIADALGEFPHARLDPGQLERKKQSTRMVKCECEHCGYVARTTRKWIDKSGAPICPVSDHGQMHTDYEPTEQPDGEEDGE